MTIDTAEILDDVRFFSGDRVFFRFYVKDRDAAADGSATPPPMDLDGRIARWSLARLLEGGLWSTEPDVDKNSSADPDQVDVDCFELVSATVAAGGSGYSVGDVLKVLGGDGFAATVKVATLGGGGAVASVTVEQPGLYATVPSSPATTKLGTNQTCTLTLTTALRRGSVLVRTNRADTDGLVGDFHQELEIVDATDGEGKVVAIGDVRIDPNVSNAE